MTAVPVAPATDRRADYVSAVAVELADLAPDDRADLIEELDDHVAALIEDRPDADLVAELGTPRAYAAELRTSAGLANATGKTPLLLRIHERWTSLQARVPNGLRPWLAALRPTWWVIRGYLIVAGLFFWWHQTWANSGLGILWPSPGGNWFMGGVVVVLGAAASVRVGTWTSLPRRQAGWLAAVLGVLALVSLIAMWDPVRYGYPNETNYTTEYVQNCPIELDNLYAYDASGKPLQNVRLVDQNGMQFDLSVFGCNSGQYAPADPAAVNAYPWPTAGPAEDPTGPPTSLAPLPGATVSSSATPGAGATPTSSPSATGSR